VKLHLHTLFTQALAQMQATGVIPKDITCEIQLERTRDSRHGDFACNMAMLLAKTVGMRPRDLANLIIKQLPVADALIAKVEVAGPGFINVFISTRAYHTIIDNILMGKETYGQSAMGAGQSVIIEFVSANPTGPLHVGHGRGAAYGAALANLLTVAGYQVHREYYVNDAGRQMDILATSVWLRYLELCGETTKFPSNGYQGDYVWDIAANLHREHHTALHRPIHEIFENILPDVDAGGDKELHIDALIERAKQLLGEVAYRHVFQEALQVILEDIRRDLEAFGVVYDEWFSEASLTATTNNMVQKTIAQLTAAGHLYEQEGAWWFRSSAFGDEKDRVVVRENGQFTYFASDIAYHLNKLERGFDLMVNIWGADHHGYIARVKAAITALGADPQRLTVLLVQFATLYRGQERLQMSTRSGEFVTLRELREEVGRDAARFFYVQRRSEQHLNFDLELAKSQSLENPVYYIQYAHARIASVFRCLSDQQRVWNHRLTALQRLDTAQEQALVVTLVRYPEVIESAAQTYEPHQLTYYLREVAQQFHVCYDAHKILVEDEELRNARLSLLAATQQVLRNGLSIIGVSAPEVM
jgi:arginyl-tRNA synthetase